ncbi:uncharacterized protein [Miscanthus floridulus]|uniref:uncharacterized protein n=1 Tax=Miscanthus floridulus TaxID=154761 RepID=UPI00345A1B9F
MAGGWNAQLIVDAPYVDVDASPSPSPSSSRRPPATSLALAAAARRTGGRYARLDNDNDNDGATTQEAINSGSSSSAAEAPMARLEGVDLLVLDARRRDAAAVLRAARPGPRGMVVVRHGDTTGGGVRRRGAASASASATAPWGTMAAGTRVVRAAYLPIGAGGVEVLHVGVGKGPSVPTALQQSRRSGRGRWIRHVDHRTGEEHVFRRQ